MTRKRFALALLLLVLLSALAVVGGHYLFRKPPITKEAFDKIEKGMTRKEVAEILGSPTESSLRLSDGTHFDYWHGTSENEGRIRVLSSNGIVFDAYFEYGHDPSLIEKIKKWLGLQTTKP